MLWLVLVLGGVPAVGAWVFLRSPEASDDERRRRRVLRTTSARVTEVRGGETVALTGRVVPIEGDSLPEAPFSKRPAVYWHAWVTEVVRRGSSHAAVAGAVDETRRHAFLLDDGSGERAHVSLDGAEVEVETTKIAQTSRGERPSDPLRDFLVAHRVSPDEKGGRPKDLTFYEEAIVPGDTVLVLGPSLRDDTGGRGRVSRGRATAGAARVARRSGRGEGARDDELGRRVCIGAEAAPLAGVVVRAGERDRGGDRSLVAVVVTSARAGPSQEGAAGGVPAEMDMHEGTTGGGGPDEDRHETEAHSDVRGVMGAEQAIAGTSGDPVLDRIERRDYRGAIEMAARAHGEAIGRLCMALLGSQAEAEETVQEVLLAAYQALPSYRAEGTVRAFLFGIGRKMCARRLETRVRRDRRLRLVHDAERDAGLPDEMADSRRNADRLRGALEELKPSERDAVVMRYASGLSYREVAQACGIEEAAARQRTSRALVRLRALLEGEG